jgi:legumain
MFEGLLDPSLSIYATTAANAVESSWATYCPEFFASSSSAANGAGLGHARAPGASELADSSSSSFASGDATAAHPHPGPEPPQPGPPPEWTTCLGDLYSVAWMEDAEGHDMTAETLERQFHLLRLRTSNNFSYVQGSHVMRYGDLEIDAELAGDYVG